MLFAVGMEGEVSEPLEVKVLTCDTIDQVKDKILQTFQRKFGFRYTRQLCDIGLGQYTYMHTYIPVILQKNTKQVFTWTFFTIWNGDGLSGSLWKPFTFSVLYNW